MKQFLFAISLVVAGGAPALAEDRKTVDPEVEQGLSLIERGANMLMRGLLQEMQPAMKDLQGMAQEWGPAMQQLRGLIGDMSMYHAPEVLPNGDIIIRRKKPGELVRPNGGNEIEL